MNLYIIYSNKTGRLITTTKSISVLNNYIPSEVTVHVTQI